MDNWKQPEKHVGRGVAYGLIVVLALVAALVVWSMSGRTGQSELAAEPAVQDGMGAGAPVASAPGLPLTETETIVAALEAMQQVEPATGTPAAVTESSVRSALDAMRQNIPATGTPAVASEGTIRRTLDAMRKNSDDEDNKAIPPQE